VGGKRDGIDALDHRGTAPFFVSCIGLYDGDGPSCGCQWPAEICQRDAMTDTAAFRTASASCCSQCGAISVSTGTEASPGHHVPPGRSAAGRRRFDPSARRTAPTRPRTS
jgi:hypothetical protein